MPRCWPACAGCRDTLGPALGLALRECGGVAAQEPGCPRPDHGRRDAPAECRLLGSLPAGHRAGFWRGPAIGQDRACRDASPSSPAMISSSSTSPWRMGKAVMDPVRDIDGVDGGHRHEPQRHGFRHPCELVAVISWFTAPVEHAPKAFTFPGFSEADANPDMGDSAPSSRPSASAASPWPQHRQWPGSSAQARHRRRRELHP